MSHISVNHITKVFHQTKALNDITLEISAGEMVGLIGASGSGKSTLLRLISALSLAEKGSVRIDGSLLQEEGKVMRGIRKYRSQIGFIFQQFNLVGRLTLITNVLTGLLHPIPWWRSLFLVFTHEEKRQALDALNRVGMSDFAWQRASTLSGGQQQRGAIARTLVQRAKTILADEPIASLDPEASRQVMEILTAINREDRVTVVIALHQVDIAKKYCSRIIALKQGVIVFDGLPSELTIQLLEKIYGSAIAEQLLESPLDAKAKTLWNPDLVKQEAFIF